MAAPIAATRSASSPSQEGKYLGGSNFLAIPKLMPRSREDQGCERNLAKKDLLSPAVAEGSRKEGSPGWLIFRRYSKFPDKL